MFVPSCQVYEVDAVMTVYSLESVMTVYNINRKGHQILCIICLCVENQNRSSSYPDEEDIAISDTTVSKLPGTYTCTYNILVCRGQT